ncbi:MAG: type II toxin-antitoxin system VapC family toxin [Thaumarchaeota archaeon]|nr:type II toxin-antitoxin system VapC family toxin [Nitrososphaerota archaeon]
MFDTRALLILYLGEEGAEKVAGILKQVLEQKITGYMNVVNLAELYYILSRKSKKIAEEKEMHIRRFGVKIVPVQDDALWREAALLKAKHSLPLADAFVASTAKVLDAKLITGSDPDFDNLGIKIERVGV